MQHKHAPERALLKRSSVCRLVRLPIDAGIAPARGLVRFCVGTDSTQTLERAVAQVELRDVVAELADVARQREALVAMQPAAVPKMITMRDDALHLHANELEGQLPCVMAIHLL